MSDAAELITDLRQRNFMVFANKKGLFVTPRGALTERDKATIRARKWELMCAVQDEQNEALLGSLVELRKVFGARLEEVQRELKSAETFRNLYKIQADMGEIIIKELRADAMRRRPDPWLDDDLLRKLICLAHPDKHGGAALANEVTSELIKLRNLRREVAHGL